MNKMSKPISFSQMLKLITSEGLGFTSILCYHERKVIFISRSDDHREVCNRLKLNIEQRIFRLYHNAGFSWLRMGLWGVTSHDSKNDWCAYI